MQLCCSPRRLQLFTVFVACVAIVTVLIILFLSNYPTFARRRIADQVVFRNGTLELQRFKTTSDLTNLRLIFYLYNVTNADEVILSSAKMNLKEIGPFVYHELKTKEFLDNNQTAGLITYKLKKQYTFSKDLSVGDPSKMLIVWPNVPLLAMRAMLDRLSAPVKFLAYPVINRLILSWNEPAFMEDTVQNFLFDGSKRTFFEKLQSLDVAHLFNPWPLKDNKFALLYGKNNSYFPGNNDNFTMSTGFGVNQSINSLNQYIFMNGQNTLPYWYPSESQCNKLGGTDGQFFAPFLNTSQYLTAYTIDICRKLTLNFKSTTQINGIKVFKFSLNDTTFEGGHKNADNLCYCSNSDGSPKYECGINGLLDLSSCIAPNIFASGAHFLHGDANLRTRFNGISPADVAQDEPTLFVEPNTGLTIQVKTPLQLNVKLEQGGLNVFNFFKENEPLYIPLVTITEAAEMTDDQAAMLRSKLLLLDSWLVSMVLGGTIVFILAISAAAIVIFLRFRGTRQTAMQSAVPSETDPLLSSMEGEPRNDQSTNQATVYRAV